MNEHRDMSAPDHWDAYWEEQSRTGYISAPIEVWDTIRSTLDVAGLQVLDLATGTGGTAARLSAVGAHVIAVDLSLRSLALAVKAAEAHKTLLAPVCADVQQLPFRDAVFDLVLSLGVMHYFPDPTPYLRELNRVVRLNGWVLVEVPQKYSLFTLHKRRLMAQGRWIYGDWETEYSVEGLHHLLQMHGLNPVRSYAREFYPRLYYMIRHLQKIDQRLGRRILPQSVWTTYEHLWQRLQHGWWGLHTLRDVGILAQKSKDV